MPAGKHKSRTLRRVFRKTPGARNVLHYRARKPKGASCSCGKTLVGVARAVANKMKNMSKTKKTVQRPFGANLCSACTRKKIVADTRQSL